jgi:hypothetical protein
MLLPVITDMVNLSTHSIGARFSITLLKLYATGQEVAGSIPCEVSRFFS